MVPATVYLEGGSPILTDKFESIISMWTAEATVGAQFQIVLAIAYH